MAETEDGGVAQLEDEGVAETEDGGVAQMEDGGVSETGQEAEQMKAVFESTIESQATSTRGNPSIYL